MIINMLSTSSAKNIFAVTPGSRKRKDGERAFTLLELLIVIGIIGSLTAIAVLILNPARYFGQSRDGRRLSEVQSINKALSFIKTTNANITYFGQPAWFYISLPDPALSGNATSTCGGLALPVLSAPWQYHCVSGENLQKTNGLGWIPVNFASSTAGVFANLPIDPVNSVTNNQFYAYSAEPYYELSAYLESEKYLSHSQNDGGDDIQRYELGPGGSPAIGTQGPPAPALSSVSPSTYWNDETASVTISGSYFQSGATAKIGTTNLTSVTVVNSTTITASVPTGITAGTYDVTVANTDTQTGTLSSGWVSTVPVYLSGALSGLYTYTNQKVVFNGNTTVTAYNGTDNLTSCDASETGCLQINAGKIVVNSGVSIDASGKGWGGGGGGGGGAGAGDPPVGGGSGGSGTRGGGNGGNGAPTYSGCYAGQAGDSGIGGGPYGGPQYGFSPGGGGCEPNVLNGDGGYAGKIGGYAAAQTNGDSTSDESLLIGSGGAGAPGGGGGFIALGDGNEAGGGGGGGAGNSGGGYVKLNGTNAISVSGSISTTGTSGNTGNGNGGGSPGGGSPGGGGNAGSAGSSGSSSGGGGASNGGNGGVGGAGAGGGVLLKSPTITVNSGVTINALGGGSSTTNGGTVKIFTDSLTNSGTISRGRLCQGTYSGSCATQ